MATTTNKAIYSGTGRRKCAIAQVRLVPGTGEIKVAHTRWVRDEKTKRTNTIKEYVSGTDYFNRIPTYVSSMKAPLETLGLENEYDIIVKVSGGGLTGQADAVKLGVARALCQLAPENRQPLKVEGYLTRDPRAKERKKYGLHKARKAPQYSKR